MSLRAKGSINDSWTALTEVALPISIAAVIATVALLVDSLLYHVVVELFSIIIAVLALITAIGTRRFFRNQYLLIVASALGWCAIPDFIHMLTYAGMGLLPVDESQVTLKLWIGARLMQALALLAAAIWMDRYVETWRLQVPFAVVTVMVIFLAFSELPPPMFAEGAGPTPIKIAFEWIIISIVALALVVFLRNSRPLPQSVRRYLPWSMACMIASEFFFTQYIYLLGPANLIGHFLRVIAYWFFYLGLVRTTLREPFGALSSAAQVYDAVPEPTLVLDRNGIIEQANVAAGRALGVAPRELVGKDVHPLFHDIDNPKTHCVVCIAHTQGETLDGVELSRRHGENMVIISAKNVELGDESRRRIEVLHDMTELHQARISASELERRHRHDLEVAKAGRALIDLLCESGKDVNTSIGNLLRELPKAFQAPHLLKIHLKTPSLSIGAPPEHARSVMLRVDLEIGDAEPGFIEVFYEEAPRDIADIFTAGERALVNDVAHTIEEIFRRSLAGHSGAT